MAGTRREAGTVERAFWQTRPRQIRTETEALVDLAIYRRHRHPLLREKDIALNNYRPRGTRPVPPLSIEILPRLLGSKAVALSFPQTRRSIRRDGVRDRNVRWRN